MGRIRKRSRKVVKSTETKHTRFLPKRLLTKVRALKFYKPRFDKAISAIVFLLFKMDRERYGIGDYMDVPSTFWEKHIDGHYERVIIPLVKANILQATGYSTTHHQCRSYRINPELFEGEFELVQFSSPNKIIDNSPECRHTLKVLRRMRLDYRAAEKTIAEYIRSGGYKKDIEIDPDLPDNTSIPVRSNQHAEFYSKHTSLDHAQQLAWRKGLRLIRDKNIYFIDDPEQYFHRKEISVRLSYLNAIQKFKNRDFYARRNEVNNRLDSNLSNFPSILIKHLTLDDESIFGLDLSNSQFQFLARLLILHSLDTFLLPPLYTESTLLNTQILSTGHIQYEYQCISQYHNKSNQSYNTYMSATLEQNWSVERHINPWLTGDIVRFIKVVKSGQLYEFIRDALRMETGQVGRDEAKKLAFRLLFAGKCDTSHQKIILRSIFPNLIRLIDKFKAVKGNEQFPILLQIEEAKLFIDKILIKLMSEGLPVLTKHDSLLCKESDLVRVESILRSILDQEFEAYNLKIEPYN